MKTILVIAVVALISNPCCSRALNEAESVVSVYTTPTNAGAPQLDVYGQIATNIAEKITSPIYTFFGINSTNQKTKRPFEHIELQDFNTTNEKPERDVEELSAEALKKAEKKPEKVTLFSSYLPVGPVAKLETLNETKNEVDDDFDDDFNLDDVEDVDGLETPRVGPFVFFLEFIGSLIQLIWGGLMAVFSPAAASTSSTTRG